MVIKTRIAPSPTGAPHVGTAYVALFNWAFAKKNGGKFLLRIEDTDRARLVKGAEEQILEALNWLGLNWDEGPIRQSDRLAIYREHAEKLVEAGYAYYCFCSEGWLKKRREEAQKKGRPPRYDGLCRKLGPVEAQKRAGKEKFVIRLKVPEQGQTTFEDLIRGRITFENAAIDDQVLLKSDGYPTYHLAVVVDDHLMGVTHILRGEEWISSTPKHILLYKAFGWEPPKLAHFPVLREASRAKLSKRHGAVGILEFQKEGYLPEALINFLALLGWSHPEGKEVFSADEFVKEFDLARVSTTAPVFDRGKLDWMNGKYLRELDVESLKSKISEYLKNQRGLGVDGELLGKVIPLIHKRIQKLSEFEGIAGFFFGEVSWSRELLISKNSSSEDVSEKLGLSLDFLTKVTKWRAEDLERGMRSLAEKEGWKTPELFMLLRVAITGRTVSPPLFESMAVLGKEKTTARIRGALKVVAQD